MAKKKIEFPAECCGTCRFALLTDVGLECFVKPPQTFLNDMGQIISDRGGDIEPTDPICYYFKPREHS